MKRKLEYNEGLSIKLAGQIISEDLHEEEEDAGMSETTAEESVNSRVYCKVTKCRTDHRVPRRFDTVIVCRIQSLLLWDTAASSQQFMTSVPKCIPIILCSWELNNFRDWKKGGRRATCIDMGECQKYNCMKEQDTKYRPYIVPYM